MDAYHFIKRFYFSYLDNVPSINDDGMMSTRTIELLLYEISPNLNFKLESSGREFNILDIKIIINSLKIHTNMYHKPTDNLQ